MSERRAIASFADISPVIARFATRAQHRFKDNETISLHA
jgi:hypothetical protein